MKVPEFDLKNRISGALRLVKAKGGGALAFCRKRRALFAPVVTMAVILAVLIGATMAWNVTVTRTYGGDSSVSSDSAAAAIMPYVVFVQQRNDDGSGGTVVTYSQDDTVMLNSYDAIMGRNDCTSAYIRMPVYGIEPGSDLTFTVTSTGTLANGQNATGTETINGRVRNLLMDQYLSNILEISCMNIPTTVIAEDASKETIYAGAKSAFTASAQADTFVNYTAPVGNEKTVRLTDKDDAITFTLTSDDYVIENGFVYVYFKLDYKYELVDAFIMALRMQLGGFKIGEAGHAEFTGLVNPGYDLNEIIMTVRTPS